MQKGRGANTPRAVGGAGEGGTPILATRQTSDTKIDPLALLGSLSRKELEERVLYLQQLKTDEQPDYEQPKARSCGEYRIWWQPSYLLDYLGLFLIVVGLGVVQLGWHVYESPFFIDNPDISLPMKQDAITPGTLGMTMFLPYLFLGLFFGKGKGYWFEDLHALTLAYVGALMTCCIAYLSMIHAVGWPRPDFLMRCMPYCMKDFRWTYVQRTGPGLLGCCDGGKTWTSEGGNDGSEGLWPTQCPSDPRYHEGTTPVVCPDLDPSARSWNNIFVDGPCKHLIGIPLTAETANCTNPVVRDCQYQPFGLYDGWRAFPSGHAANATAAYTVLSFYIFGQTRIFQRVTTVRTFFPGLFFLALLYIYDMTMCLTRVADNKHPLFAVTFGAIMGFASALPWYFLYWSPFWLSDRPLRRKRDSSITLFDEIYKTCCCRKFR
jgi:membrane-associated phospholipid phosphatase